MRASQDYLASLESLGQSLDTLIRRHANFPAEVRRVGLGVALLSLLVGLPITLFVRLMVAIHATIVKRSVRAH